MYKVGDYIRVIANYHSNNYEIGKIYKIKFIIPNYAFSSPYWACEAEDERGWVGNWLRAEEIIAVCKDKLPDW